MSKLAWGYYITGNSMIYAARGVLLTYEHEVELVGWGGMHAFKMLVGKPLARFHLKDRREGRITLRYI